MGIQSNISDGGTATRSWSIDPDGVAAVLSLIDISGMNLDTAGDTIVRVADSADQLAAGNRTTVSLAWERFWEERRSVPRKLLHLTYSRASQVSQAAAEIVSGDVVMASDTNSSAAIVEDHWGILPASSYDGGEP